jgi:prepilin-type N-terminal cleavage/methylation domain-containing protein
MLSKLITMVRFRKTPRAFTLVELLIVISIIGILSAVVLASLNISRNKSNDATIKSEARSFATQSALYYDASGGSYATAAISAAGPSQAACATASTVFLDPRNVQILSVIDKAANGAGGATPTNVKCAINGTATAWVIYAPLAVPVSGTGWCIDSTGIVKPDTAPVAYNCP